MNPAKTLILSPHFDDVALSLGGTLLSEFFPRPIEYVNFFTVSRHAVIYRGIRDPAHVTPLRTSEDDEFAICLDLRHRNLGLIDASIRILEPGGSFPFLAFSSLLIDIPRCRVKIPRRLRLQFIRRQSITSAFLTKAARIGGAYSTVRARIRSLMFENPQATLVAPLGLGNHPDHLLVSIATKSLEGLARQVYYYEDLPYALTYTLSDLQRQVSLFDHRLRPKLVDATPFLDRKLANMSIYRTQMTNWEMWGVVKHAKRIVKAGAAERLWTYKSPVT